MTFWIYLGGTALYYFLALAPSRVHTRFTWWGVLIEVGLLFALFLGSVIARRVLIFLGVLAAFGGVAVQGGGSPLDVMATLDSLLALLMAGLLMTPAIRRYASVTASALTPR